MSFFDVQAASVQLLETIDAALTAHDEVSAAVRHADWTYYRFGTVEGMARQRVGGTAAAALARGLLEEAAYWDWSLATQVDDGWVDRLAAAEFERLQARADPTDNIWLEWVIPPGERISGDGTGVPRTRDVMKGLGNGFTSERLAPLSIGGLFAVYKLIELVTHGSAATALLLSSDDGCDMTPELAAAVLHTAGAGAAAIVACHLDLTDVEAEQLGASALSLAQAASDVHGLPLNVPNTRPPAKARTGSATVRTPDISRMPAPDAAIHAVAAGYVRSAGKFKDQLMSLGPQTAEPMALLAASTFDLASAHLAVLAGICNGTAGRALLPVAARALFEDGARWGWLHQGIAARPDGRSLKSVLGDAAHFVAETRKWMRKEGMAADVADRFLSRAADLEQLKLDGYGLPKMEDMISITYPARTDRTFSSLAIYGILSQFVHYSPIATMHLQHDEFTSISAPTFAVAVEAACHGHFMVVMETSKFAFGPACEAAMPALEEAAEALADVMSVASAYHFLD